METKSFETGPESVAAGWLYEIRKRQEEELAKLARMEKAVEGRTATKEEYEAIKQQAKLAEFFEKMNRAALLRAEAEMRGYQEIGEKMDETFALFGAAKYN